MAPALMIAGAGLGAYGAIYEGQAAEAEAKSSAAMSEYNAQLQEREAKQEEIRTQREQKLQYQAGQRQMSSLNAAMGGAGVVSTAGTPLLIQATQASELEMENLLIGQEGMERAQASRSGAALSRMEAKAAKYKGKAAKTASYFKAGSTLLGGFGGASSQGAFSGGGTGIQKGAGQGWSANNRYGAGLNRNFGN